MDILRFLTAGSVDDGKSTLIGRLLYDSKSILTDQLEVLEKQSKNKEAASIDLALLTDGLRAEREQGITIDVAYRYFATPKRKFIIADAPGHVQYTRNMITGASNTSLIIILIDARLGVVEQTKRHSIIAAMLGMNQIVVAINKMDLVNFDENIFNKIVNDYNDLAARLNIRNITYIPMSALRGDNIVDVSKNMNWYSGKPLLQFLEDVEIDEEINNHAARFQVQFVIRPQTKELHDYRGYAGKIINGTFKKGDKIKILPQGIESEITALEIGGKELPSATSPQSVTIQIKDDIDISRGDTFSPLENSPLVSNEIETLLCWMDDKPLMPGNKYLLQHNSRQVRAIVKELNYKLDVNTLEHLPIADSVKLNEVVKATIKTASPLVFDSFKQIPHNGAAILIDETSNSTAAAVIIQ